MTKKLGRSCLLASTLIVLSLLTSCVSEAKSKIIYLHEQEAQKRSPQDLFDSFTGTGKVVVVFYADWCGPCRRMAPVVEEFAQDLAEDFTVIKVNVDHYRSIFTGYGLKTIPAILFFNNGKLVYTQPVSTTKKELKKIVSSNY
jgi:thioredoxin 1